MKVRRTERSNTIYTLPGGNEDNDLWACRTVDEDEGNPVIGSTWVPSEEERAAIAAGANIELLIWGTMQPPVAMRLDDSKILGSDAPLPDDLEQMMGE